MYNKDMLKSNVPLEMEKRNMKPQDLVDAGVVSPRIAREIYKGSTKLRLHTLEELCKLFDVKFLDDLISYLPDQEV